MAEGVVISATSLLDKLEDDILSETHFLGSVKKEILNLRGSIALLRVLLLDSEEHLDHDHDHDHVPSSWLRKVMDVFNEADNLLYDIAAANSERKKLKGGSIGSKVRHYCSSLNPLAFNCWIAFKIKAINGNLQEVLSPGVVSQGYGLREYLNVTQRERARETFPFVDPSNIIGRVEDKEKIIEILIQPTKGDDVTLLPIVGIRGLGKTTLAQLVYNDERIKMQFELELWICVSTKISLEELVRKIIVSIGMSQRQECMDDMTLGDLSYEFLKLLGGKRYLLLLDNVGDVDKESCFVLKRLFMKGANGSRILVTTRSNGIAKFMATVPPFELERLSFQDSLSLFFRVFFRDRPDSLPPSYKIVEEFVQSCGGVPLAIELIGMLLSSNNTLENRKAVRDLVILETNPFHDVLLPILKSNYDILSPDLRQCFKRCAFFPRDYEFNSFELIQFWETFGVIKFKDDYKAIGIENEYEAMGEENLEHLCSVSLLKVCKKELFYSKFRIPQLIYDMALYLVRDEFTMVKSSTRIINKRIKHLTFVKPKLSQPCARGLLDNIGLIQTLIFFDKVEQYLVESFIQRCQHLQVLILRNSSLKALPRGIGGLKCLKYLDLTGNKSFKEIPNSLCILHNLKTLILDGCAEVEELPRDIRKLRSLNMLLITTKQRYLPENGVGCLRSLRFLAIIGCQNLKYLPQYINLLTSLRTWIIRDCDSLISLPSSMKYLIE